MWTLKLALACCFALCCLTPVLEAQEMPADYKQVLDALGRQGDFKEGVLKVNIPRNDLKVAVHHMIGTTPDVFFLHYWGRGPAQKLAAAVRAAVDQTARPTR